MKLILAVAFCLLLQVYASLAAENATKFTHVLQLKDGKVRGIVEEASHGHHVDSYTGDLVKFNLIVLFCTFIFSTMIESLLFISRYSVRSCETL